MSLSIFYYVCALYCGVFVICSSAASVPSLTQQVLAIRSSSEDNTADKMKFHDMQPNSYSILSSPEGVYASFENGTSLLKGPMQKRFLRVKRDACNRRPDEGEAEVMEYFGLKLPNRCWEDCDCKKGRYCTKHNWCNDIGEKSKAI